jgi:hypothetical protein
MMLRRWKDQPKCLDGAEVLFTSSLHGLIVEIRRVNSIYYVSTGNLFGSQTVKVLEADLVFYLLQTIQDALDANKEAVLPDGCSLLQNDSRTFN